MKSFTLIALLASIAFANKCDTKTIYTCVSSLLKEKVIFEETNCNLHVISEIKQTENDGEPLAPRFSYVEINGKWMLVYTDEFSTKATTNPDDVGFSFKNGIITIGAQTHKCKKEVVKKDVECGH